MTAHEYTRFILVDARWASRIVLSTIAIVIYSFRHRKMSVRSVGFTDMAGTHKLCHSLIGLEVEGDDSSDLGNPTEI